MSEFKPKLKKVLLSSGVVVSSLVGNVVSATGEETSQAVVTALQATASEITKTITAIAPIALGIAGTFLVWRYGMRFFKSISK